MKERNVTGLGIDYRRQLQKLEIAHDCALGVDGVEVDMRPGSADADAVTGITEGLQYALDYEDRIQWRFRKDRASVNLFDCTEGESPFAEFGPRGSLSRYIYMNIKKYGPLQAVVHADSDWRMVSIFNWDFYQSKKVRLEIPGIPENLRVNLDVDGKKSHPCQAVQRGGFAGDSRWRIRSCAIGPQRTVFSKFGPEIVSWRTACSSACSRGRQRSI